MTILLWEVPTFSSRIPVKLVQNRSFRHQSICRISKCFGWIFPTELLNSRSLKKRYSKSKSYLLNSFVFLSWKLQLIQQSQLLSQSIWRFFPNRAEINVYLFKSIIVTQFYICVALFYQLWRFLQLYDCFGEISKIKVLRKLRNVFKCLTFAHTEKSDL